ncbi:DinB family protein [Planctomicrobium piriforme]|uniref:DinB superfamily protein n=1 Tax=Planctomicrobium piriforme TaxID=1576369 RepID=A0A1I3BDN3_9PLAN|nr:DinB family protein [Planctomicrobium piriforme]SFH60417.1 DinB superfamily protein [Planctomicrobium piriforme]
MLELAIKQNKFLLGYTDGLVRDVADERFTEQPLPKVNHPAWILGHLAYAGDGCVGLLGGDKTLSPEWLELFKGGTSLTDVRSNYPSKDELLASLRKRYETAQALAERITPEQAMAPNGHARLKESMPQVQDLASFLLTGHFAVHLGQLSMWRRMIGLPPMF